jgi:prolyl-tRNA synthetase
MKDAKTQEVAESLYAELHARGHEVLMDDRDERAGVKFKDADLIGIPIQMVIGEKNLKDGLVEIKDRKTKEVTRIKVEDVVEHIASF